MKGMADRNRRDGKRRQQSKQKKHRIERNAKNSKEREDREKKVPTAEQYLAVMNYAERHGDKWMTELLHAWRKGTDASEPGGHLLRQVRNKFGPKWLLRERKTC